MLLPLAESGRVREVFLRHVFRYFFDRNITPGDAVTLQEADKAYLESGGSPASGQPVENYSSRWRMGGVWRQYLLTHPAQEPRSRAS